MYTKEISNSISPVKTEATYDENGAELTPEVLKTQQEITDEETQLITDKTAEIQSKIDTYVAAQNYQKTNGGPGPVGDFETMKIVNEHASAFEVIFKV